MGKSSIKENKNAYQLARDKIGYTREQASELMFISSDRIERIENRGMLPHPDEVLAMAECYKEPALCNYYCAKECEIGKISVSEITSDNLAQITLEMLASLNAMEKEKNRLIEITVDGVITEDEMDDYRRIENQLSQISLSVNSLKLWVEKAIADGKIEK